MFLNRNVTATIRKGKSSTTKGRQKGKQTTPASSRADTNCRCTAALLGSKYILNKKPLV